MVRCHWDGWLSLCLARMGLGSILTVSYLAYVGKEWAHYVWCEVEWNHLQMNVWDMHHKCAYVFKMENEGKLIEEGMNELMYDSILGGYPIWNLQVAHVDPVGWSTLAKLGNLDGPLAVSSQWKRSNGIMWVCYYMSFWASFVNVFLVQHAHGKRESNITLHMCIFVNCLTCVVY